MSYSLDYFETLLEVAPRLHVVVQSQSHYPEVIKAGDFAPTVAEILGAF